MSSWYTFWAVLFFSGIGILLGILQVILQEIQTSYAIKSAR